MFKSLIIKIIAGFLLGIGGKRSRIDPRRIKKILVNRSDRIGDAVISLPFLVELSKRFDVTVLTSGYNDFILRPFLKTRIIIDNPPKLGEVLSGLTRNFFRPDIARDVKRDAEYDLYLDLVGVRGLPVFLSVRKENLCVKYAGFNLGPWNRLLDYAYRGSVELSNTEMCVAYRRLIKECLGLEIAIPDHLDLSDKMRVPADRAFPEKYILVNISGRDKFRGPSPRCFAGILNALDYPGAVMIMDELGQPNMAEFRKYIVKDNITYLRDSHTIWELLGISARAQLYIGSDSGINHLLEIPANAVIFFANTTCAVWKPYSRNGYRKSRIRDITVEDTVNSGGLRKKIIHRHVWCSPCYDAGCRGRECVAGLEKESLAIAIQIKDMLEQGSKDRLC